MTLPVMLLLWAAVATNLLVLSVCPVAIVVLQLEVWWCLEQKLDYKAATLLACTPALVQLAVCLSVLGDWIRKVPEQSPSTPVSLRTDRLVASLCLLACPLVLRERRLLFVLAMCQCTALVLGTSVAIWSCLLAQGLLEAMRSCTAKREWQVPVVTLISLQERVQLTPVGPMSIWPVVARLAQTDKVGLFWSVEA